MLNMGKSIDKIPRSIEGSATLSIMTLSLMTFSIMTLSLTTFITYLGDVATY
jgi:hypothetical protein